MFYDSDKHLIPVMMWLIGEKVGEKTYDFNLAKQCSDHAVHMSRVGHRFHSNNAHWYNLPENTFTEVVEGENFQGAIEKIVEKMFSSEKYRKNLEQYPVIGIGTAVGQGEFGRLKIYVAQRFRH